MVSIAVLGYGTVGTGVTELINKNKDKFKNITGEELNISSILVRNIDKHIHKQNFNVITDNIDSLFAKPIDIVVEVMCGINPAYEYVKKALTLRKHVVTANKDLIAEHGKELLDLANQNGVNLNFEASVGGGIPILKPLMECLSGNEIIGIKAILNGTTNFILSKMDKENMDYKDALKIAQELGFAEANPESDVLGYDAARKISILSTIAYNQKVNWKDLDIQGITSIDKKDFKYAQLKGYTIKLLALSKKLDNKVYASVKPILIKINSNLGQIEDELNGIVIEGDAVGDIFFSGKGAGMFPTASSVFGDITDIVQNKSKKVVSFNYKRADIEKIWSEKCSWLVRIHTNNRLEVVCSIAKEFKNCYFYAENLTTKEEVVCIIHDEYENELNSKVKKLLSLPYVYDIKKFMEI
jgi:homoserine dehydrogenase